MIYGFAKQSDGHLSIYSEIGVGTTVRLYLPKARTQQHSAETAPAAAEEPLLGGETILVVDDNAELRSVAVRRLTALGYNCFEAESGRAALAILDSGVRFDLLFTDVGLPEGMLGHELAKLAEQRQPWLKVLFTTGYAKVQKGENDNQPDLNPMLRKPYRGQELAETVRAILSSVP